MIFLACYYKIFKGPKNLPRKKSTHKSFCCVSFKKHNGDMPNQFEATLVDRHLPSTVAEHDDLRHGLRIPSCYFSQVKSSMGVILLESHLPGAPASGLTEKNIYMVPCPVLPPPPPPPPPHGMGPPPPPPIPHTFCTRHCSETYISILLHARRCSETHIFILLDEPSRRIRWVDRAKLWRNANFKLQEWLRAVYRTLQCSANGIIYIYIYISMYIHIHKHQ